MKLRALAPPLSVVTIFVSYNQRCQAITLNRNATNWLGDKASGIELPKELIYIKRYLKFYLNYCRFIEGLTLKIHNYTSYVFLIPIIKWGNYGDDKI